MHPKEQICNASEDEMFCFAILVDNNDATIYSDLAGRFPVRSYSGMNYFFCCICVFNQCNINATNAKPLGRMHGRHVQRHVQNPGGARPASKATCFRQWMFKSRARLCTFWGHIHPASWTLQPSYQCCRASSEVSKVSRTGWFSPVHPDCPLQLWNRFLAQMQDTMNMLRTSRRNVKVSAYKEMEGPFDFNKTPMSILGTKGVAYLDPDDRASWQPHGVDTLGVNQCTIGCLKCSTRTLEAIVHLVRTNCTQPTAKYPPSQRPTGLS